MSGRDHGLGPISLTLSAPCRVQDKQILLEPSQTTSSRVLQTSFFYHLKKWYLQGTCSQPLVYCSRTLALQVRAPQDQQETSHWKADRLHGVSAFGAESHSWDPSSSFSCRAIPRRMCVPSAVETANGCQSLRLLLGNPEARYLGQASRCLVNLISGGLVLFVEVEYHQSRVHFSHGHLIGWRERKQRMTYGGGRWGGWDKGRAPTMRNPGHAQERAKGLAKVAQSPHGMFGHWAHAPWSCTVSPQGPASPPSEVDVGVNL